MRIDTRLKGLTGSNLDRRVGRGHLNSQLSELHQARGNVGEGTSNEHAAERALSSVQAMLGRIRDLVIESAEVSDSPTQRAAHNEIMRLRDEIDRMSRTAAVGGEAGNLVDGALDDLSRDRGQLGAVQTRFDSTIAKLEVARENLMASHLRSADVDVSAQILSRAGDAMLARANAAPQEILELLQ